MELAFAEDYGEVRGIVRRYTYEMHKLMRRIGRKSWLEQEGGIAAVQWAVLTYIIEEGDVERGLKAYAKYVNHEYANRNRSDEVIPLTFIDELQLEDPAPFGGADPSGWPLIGSSAVDLALSDEELAVFQALGDNNMDTKLAAHALDVTPAYVRKVYRRVHSRRRYAEDKNVRERRKAKARRERRERAGLE